MIQQGIHQANATELIDQRHMSLWSLYRPVEGAGITRPDAIAFPADPGPRIGWKSDGVWTRYPGAFNWSIEAPEGHMPLINQLRGVRLMDSLLNHPALVARRF